MILLLALLSVTPAPATNKIYRAVLKQCFDGDTCFFDIELSTDVKDVGLDVQVVNTIWLLKQRVRFCDIDAPEVNPRATREAGLKSRDALLAILMKATELELLVMGEDSFGRWLVYVIADGAYVNSMM